MEKEEILSTIIDLLGKEKIEATILLPCPVNSQEITLEEGLVRNLAEDTVYDW